MKISTTKERLKEIMEIRGLKQADVVRLAQPYCKKYGVKLTAPNMTQYIKDGREPSQDKLVILGLVLNVSESWLMGADVPMNKEVSSGGAANDIMLIKKFSKLNSRDKEIVMNLIDTMLKKSGDD